LTQESWLSSIRGSSDGVAFCSFCYPRPIPPNAGNDDTHARPLDPFSGGRVTIACARRSDRPTHRGGNFAARRYLYACDHRPANGYESTDQVGGIVPVPPMEMKGNGTVLEHPTTPSASEEQPCPVSTSRQFAGRSRWSRCWTCSASSPRHDRGCSGREAVRCTPLGRAIAARSR
jgi:hypothetical protein